MKEMVKSKIMIGFIMFILGFVYINTPAINYESNNNELSKMNDTKTTYNI